VLTTAAEPDNWYAGRRVCVTGGAGFIGSHLVDALVSRGAAVSALDDLSSGRLENLAESRARVKFVLGSIRDSTALDAAMSIDGEAVEVVFHQAAIASVPRSVEQPDQYVQVNVMGTLNVLEAARRASGASGKPRVIYASSSSVYGESAVLPKVETMPPRPLSPYAASKHAGECLLQSHCQCFDMSGLSLRYFNVFGPRQRHDSAYAAVIPRFLDALRSGQRPIVHGDGRQTRDFTYIDNVVQANLLAGSRDLPAWLCGRPINIARGERWDLLNVLGEMQRLLGTDIAPQFTPARPGDVRDSVADVSLARRLLGYEPAATLVEGLRRMLGNGARAA
jgi:UDP-glucose 4-epimerase